MTDRRAKYFLDQEAEIERMESPPAVQAPVLPPLAGRTEEELKKEEEELIAATGPYHILTPYLRAIPDFARTLPEITPLVTLMTGCKIPELPISAESLQEKCESVNVIADVFIEWGKSPILFAWLFVSTIMQISTSESMAISILLPLHTMLVLIQAMHSSLRSDFVKAIDFTRYLQKFRHGEKIAAWIKDYSTLGKGFGIRYADWILFRPLERAADTAMLLPSLLYLSSLHWMLLKSGALIVGPTSSTILSLFWVFQIATMVIVDFRPDYVFRYAAALNAFAALHFVTGASSLIYCALAIAVSAAIWLFVDRVFELNKEEPLRAQVQIDAYLSWGIMYLVLGLASTAFWYDQDWTTCGALFTSQIVLGFGWSILSSLAWLSRAPVLFDNEQICVDRQEVLVLLSIFATGIAAMQHGLLSAIHFVVAVRLIYGMITQSVLDIEAKTERLNQAKLAVFERYVETH